MKSYITKIAQSVTNMSSKIRIIYLESDYPGVLDMVLDNDMHRGSVDLKSWLGTQRFGFAEACKRQIARPFLEVFKNETSFGKLKCPGEESSPHNPKSEISFELSKSIQAPHVNFKLPNSDVALRVSVNLVAEAENAVQLFNDQKECTYIQIQDAKTRDSLLKCSLERIESDKIQPILPCRFFI